MKETVFTSMMVAGLMAAYAYLIGYAKGSDAKKESEYKGYKYKEI